MRHGQRHRRQQTAGFAKRLRKGEITSEAATEMYLKRIEILDPKLQSFEYVAKEQAMETARAMDTLLSAGIDLGPLMGVPAAVKDLIAIEGMPTTAIRIRSGSSWIPSKLAQVILTNWTLFP